MDEKKDELHIQGITYSIVQGEHNIVTNVFEGENNRLALIPVEELHYENFNMGDDAATHFPYIIEPLRESYAIAVQALDNAGGDARGTKRGILVIGEANAGKTRLAIEAIKYVLPNWLLLHWGPGETLQTSPTQEALRENNVIVFIDDLQRYIPSTNTLSELLLLMNNIPVETLRALLKRINAFAKRMIIVATCRTEDVERVHAYSTDLFEALTIIKLKQFNTDVKDPQTTQIITAFREKGAEHVGDWDGTLGSLVLGLARKRSFYEKFVADHEPAATVLRAMKLLTKAGTTQQTETQIRKTCLGVFGEEKLAESEQVWRATVQQLTRAQFLREEVDTGTREIILSIRKDTYFDQVITDYPSDDQPHRLEQDFLPLQKVLRDLKDAVALCKLGFVYSSLGWYETAITSFDQVIFLKANNFSQYLALAFIGKGLTLLVALSPSKAEEGMTVLDQGLALGLASPLQEIALTAKALMLAFVGPSPETMKIFEQALALGPVSPVREVILMAEGLVFVHLKRYAEAVAVFDQALDPNLEVQYTAVKKLLSLAWSEKGQALTELKQYEEAVGAFDHTLALNPNDAGTWSRKGQALIKLERRKDAITAFDHALALEPSNADLWQWKGEQLHALGRTEEALTVYDQALVLNPNMPKTEVAQVWLAKVGILAGLERYKEAAVALEQIGKQFHALGGKEQALYAYDQALALNPNMPKVWLAKAEILMDLGRYKEAEAALEQVKNAPNFKFLRALDNQLIWVQSVALSRDGQILVSSGFNGITKVWDVPAGRRLQDLSGHTKPVWSVALSGDSQILASGGMDPTIKIWHVATGRRLQDLSGHMSMVSSVALSEDGQTLASGSEDKTIKIWSVATGRCQQTLSGHTDAVWSVALSGDGQTLVSGSKDGTIKVWDRMTGHCQQTLSGHTDAVWSVIFSRNGQILVSGSDDCTIKVWDRTTGRCQQTLSGHTSNITSVALSGDGQTLVSGSKDGTIKVWDGTTGRCQQTLSGHTHSLDNDKNLIWSVALSEDGQILVSGSLDDVINVWKREEF